MEGKGERGCREVTIDSSTVDGLGYCASDNTGERLISEDAQRYNIH